MVWGANNDREEEYDLQKNDLHAALESKYGKMTTARNKSFRKTEFLANWWERDGQDFFNTM